MMNDELLDLCASIRVVVSQMSQLDVQVISIHNGRMVAYITLQRDAEPLLRGRSYSVQLTRKTWLEYTLRPGTQPPQSSETSTGMDSPDLLGPEQGEKPF